MNCLKEWLKSKVTERTPPNLHSFMWKTFECDLCKLPFPYVLRIGDARYNLVNIRRPVAEEVGKVAYIILESLGLDKNSSRMVHTLMVNLSDIGQQEGPPQFKLVSTNTPYDLGSRPRLRRSSQRYFGFSVPLDHQVQGGLVLPGGQHF